MTSVLLALVVAASGGVDKSYSDAHRDMKQTGRPLVVLVGADWCPGCVRMKQTLADSHLQSDVLDKVAFARVDADRESKLAKKLLKGSSIPQLVMFRRTPKGWRASRLVGAQDASRIEAFVEEGLADAATKSQASTHTTLRVDADAATTKSSNESATSVETQPR